MLFIYIFSGILILLYIRMIISFHSGWDALQCTSSAAGTTFVTVVVAFRNEERNLPALIKALRKQNYPISMRHFIFVDDHSSDNSVPVLQRLIRDLPGSEIITLPAHLSGKKQALHYGVNSSSSGLLLFTDADCTMGSGWISTFAGCYEAGGYYFISGPVRIIPGRGLFSLFQALEFLSLTGSAGASFGNGKPIMANGANIAVKKDIYIESLDDLIIKTPSGDDMFLLAYIKKKYPGKLCFARNTEGIVSTRPANSINTFISQRMRWVSKARYYRDKAVIFTALNVFIVNFWILICLAGGFLMKELFIAGAAMLILKSIADYSFLKKVASFCQQLKLMRIFVFSELVYFLYVVITGLPGNFISVKWKGRRSKI